MLRMNSSFIKRMNIRIARCISEPALAGRLIIDQLCDLAKCKKLDINKMSNPDLYVKLFSSQTMRSQACEFQNRVFQMRDLTPTCIDVGSRFLTSKFRTLRLADFPRMHPYICTCIRQLSTCCRNSISLLVQLTSAKSPVMRSR